MSYQEAMGQEAMADPFLGVLPRIKNNARRVCFLQSVVPKLAIGKELQEYPRLGSNQQPSASEADALSN